jgi:very-short-patch-repair endonuclease
LRLIVVRSGLSAPVPQFPVRVDGRFVARVDLAWPEHRVAVEDDGLWHAEPGQFARDRQRLDRLQAAGWRIVFVTAEDLHRPGELVARIARALTEAGGVHLPGSGERA